MKVKFRNYSILLIAAVITLSICFFLKNNKGNDVSINNPIQKINLNANYKDCFDLADIRVSNARNIDQKLSSPRTLCLKNSDETETLYAFANAVNFKTDNGYKLIDTRIKNTENKNMFEKGYVYSVAENDIIPYFNFLINSKKGIAIQAENIQAEILSRRKRNATAKYVERENFISKNRSMINYGNILADETETFIYPSTLGVNSEVVFKSNNVQKLSFNLKINTSGIRMKKEPGGYLILYKGQGTVDDIVGVIQVPIIKDKNNNFYFNSILKAESMFGKTVKITIIPDQKVDLKDAVMYFSIDIRKGNQPDNCLYSNNPNLTNNFLNNFSTIGKNNAGDIGRLMVRFETAKDFLFTSEKVISAKYNIYCLSSNKASKAYAVNVLEDWCAITGNWNSKYKTGEKITDGILSDNVYQFDITDEFKKWSDDESGELQHNGIQIRNEEIPGDDIILASNDCTLFNNYTEIVFTGDLV